MDKKTILAFVLIGLLLILMPYYYNLVSPPQEPADSLATEAPRGRTPNPRQIPAEAVKSAPVTGAGRFSGETPAAVETSAAYQTGKEQEWFTPDPPDQAQTVVVETPLYRAEFSTHGASVRSWIIKPSQPYLHEPEELVRPRFADRNLVLEMRGGRGLLRTSEKNFTVNRNLVRLRDTDSPDTLIFTLKLGETATYTETYIFYPDRYSVDLFIESHGLGRLTGAANALFTWGGGLAPTELDSAQDAYYTQSYYLIGNSRGTFKSSGKKINEEQTTGPTRWVAQRIKYFLMAIVPAEPADGISFYTWPDSLYRGKYPPRLFETGLVFNLPDGDINRKMQIYLGPLEKSFVTQVDPTLEQTMSWGWTIIKPFSVAVLWSLKEMHRVIPNYGVVLLIFSLLIKLIVWPLTHKSYKSTKRMQSIQPLIKSIQAKYKSDPQRMQKEVMSLYKEYKVNPAGGCWPTLLQMPLLYSLFIVFRSTIELRGQPFIFWIKDLSMPDVLFQLPFSIPLYGNHVCVLPLIMAVSTFLQSRQTMTDPNQKTMLYLMPLMFIFLFNNFPSGLTLYYTIFNILSWAQQKIISVNDPELERKIEEARLELELEEKRRARKKGGGKPQEA